MTPRFRHVPRPMVVVATVVGSIVASLIAPVPATASTTTLIGSGSSFAGPEVLQWTADTAQAALQPDGRLHLDELRGRTVQLREQHGRLRRERHPVPVTGLRHQAADIPLHLCAGHRGRRLPSCTTSTGFARRSSCRATPLCAIMTGGVQMWNDPIIAGRQSGGQRYRPWRCTRSSAPTWPGRTSCCRSTASTSSPPCGGHSSPHRVVTQNPGQVGRPQPHRSAFGLAASSPPAIEASGSADAADDVAVPNNDGYITAVETGVCAPAQLPVGSVKNASGDYTQPDAGRRGLRPGLRHPER